MPFKPVDQNIKITIGPAIDDTDMKTRETGIAYNAAGMDVDIILEKHDGTIVTTSVTPTTGGDYDWAHIAQGDYELELPADGATFDNDTEGVLYAVAYVTGVLPMRSVKYDIVPEKVYNSLVEGTDNLEVDAVAFSGSATAADNAEIVYDTDFATNYNTTRNAWVTNHTDYIGAIPAAALDADCITAAKIADDAIVAANIATGALTADAFAADAIVAATLATGALTADAFAADALVAATFATDSIAADALAADAVTEIQSGLATAANLATVAGYLDTEIAAILEDTGTSIPALIAALNNLSAAQVNAEVDTALSDYDGPTKAEMDTAHALLATIAKQDVIDGIVDAILTDTGTTIPGLIAALNDLSSADANAAADTALSDWGKTGFSLAATGLDAISASDPGGVATTVAQMLVQTWRRLFMKTTLTATELKTYADNGSTVRTTQTVSDDGTTQTQGAAS